MSSLATTASGTTWGRAVLDFLHATITCLRVVLHDLAFEDPDLDTDDTIGSQSFNLGVVNVSAQGVQRHTTFTIPFSTCNLGTAKATCDVYTDPFSTHAHCVLNGTLHGATE